MPGSILGTQVRRVEDQELLLGQGAFVDNLDSDGVAHAVFVRSPFAHARITGIDTAEAGAADGVLGVYTADDLGRQGLPSFADVDSPDMGSMMTETPDGHLLVAHDRYTNREDEGLVYRFHRDLTRAACP